MLDIQNLDIEDILEWPRPVQLFFILLLAVLILPLGYYFYLLPKSDRLEALKLSEDSKKSIVQVKAGKASKRSTVSELEIVVSRYYSEYKAFLISDSQRASILSSINRLALESNLTLKRLRWGEKVHNEFFYLLPLEISLTGQFDDIGFFSERVAHLPQIITFQDTKWSRVRKDSQILHLQITAYGYQNSMEGK